MFFQEISRNFENKFSSCMKAVFSCLWQGGDEFRKDLMPLLYCFVDDLSLLNYFVLEGTIQQVAFSWEFFILKKNTCLRFLREITKMIVIHFLVSSELFVETVVTNWIEFPWELVREKRNNKDTFALSE